MQLKQFYYKATNVSSRKKCYYFWWSTWLIMWRWLLHGYVWIFGSEWHRSSMAMGLIMMTSSNGNFFRVTGHLCGEFTGPRWIPRTKASDAKLWCFLWSAHKRLSKLWWGWWLKTPSCPLWRHGIVSERCSATRGLTLEASACHPPCQPMAQFHRDLITHSCQNKHYCHDTLRHVQTGKLCVEHFSSLFTNIGRSLVSKSTPTQSYSYFL